MRGRSRVSRTLLMVAATLSAISCSDSPTDVGSAALFSVAPGAESTGVSLNAVIEVHFTEAVSAQAIGSIALQVGACPGPVVAGTWSRSPDGTVLTFSPMSGLTPGTRYTIHVGGGMTDTHGTHVDLESYGPGHGGTWVTESMVLGMSGFGMGMGMGASHAGPAWRHPNGSYGLAFGFTTGS